MQDSNDEDDDDFIVVEHATPQKANSRKSNTASATSREKSPARLKRKQLNGSRSSKLTSSQSEASQELPLSTTHSDPSNNEVVEWMIEDTWKDPTCFNNAIRSKELEEMLEACSNIQESPDCTEEIRALTRKITLNAMALTDRVSVECELLRQIVNDELIEHRRATVAFVEAYRQEEARTHSTSKVTIDAMANVLKVNSALRGVYPHISLAHPHPRPPSNLPTTNTTHSTNLIHTNRMNGINGNRQ